MIDCHDGIPVKPDLDGLYEPAQVREVVDVCLARGGNPSLIVSPEHQDPDGFDVHQIRGTLYSLLDCDDDAFIAARAIQLFAPGIPQIYYVGLLAGENDQATAVARGDGREINRHNFSREEIALAARRNVVERLERLIRLRNSHPAFQGAFDIRLAARDRLRLAWATGTDSCTLEVDLQLMRSSIQMSRAGGTVEALEL
jgi:sucrose 6(F)-phosphate phosphorylase